MTDHFRLLLDGIDADLASGKLDEEQARAAKGELAREMLRSKKDSAPSAARELGTAPLAIGIVASAALALGLYALIGSPNLPAYPLADRADAQAQQVDLATAIARIEEQLTAKPNDLRGWTVIAPAYVELGRFADAERAYRRVIELGGATPELQTNLAEVLLLGAQGQGSVEATELLTTAAAADPENTRSRLYLAAEAMRIGNYPAAITRWQEALALAKGDEPWLAAARQGLAVAQNGGVDNTAAEQQEMIAGMVSGLADRLYASGGSVEEWMQLVRSYIILNDIENAQKAYDASVVQYPTVFERGELDTIALSAGLKLNGGQ